MDDIPLFRVNKRRKFARSKNNPIEDDTEISQPLAEQNDNETAEDDQVNVANLLKQRQQARQRATGVRFSQRKRAEDDQDSDELAKSIVPVTTNPAEERLKDISNRFVGSTGQVVDVDKHMMAYIDSQMARNRSAAAQEAPDEYTDSESYETAGTSTTTGNPQRTSHIPSQHQLSEIDLGPGVHATNLARTSAAIARAQSGLPPPTDDPQPRRPRKPRLGRDGKPLRPRPRRGRNSEDIARDALVEQMLREHKVDTSYDGAAGADPANAANEGDADERLAQQFRQDFMDAMAERQQRSQVRAAAAARAKGVGTESSGPKLGGGRSARAKMAQLQQQQKSASGQK